MYYEAIATYAKAKQYALEADERIHFIDTEHVHFRGRSAEYELIRINGEWTCTCDRFALRQRLRCERIPALCKHTLAVEMTTRCAAHIAS